MDRKEEEGVDVTDDSELEKLSIDDINDIINRMMKIRIKKSGRRRPKLTEEEHKEKRRIKGRLYYERNRDKILEKRKKESEKKKVEAKGESGEEKLKKLME